MLYTSGLIAFFSAVAVALALTTGHLNMAAYVPCFICGILSYTLTDRVKQQIPSVLWPIFIVAVIIAFCIVNLRFDSPYWLVWILALILGLAIPIFHSSTSVIANTVAESIARYSYGMYLLHVPVLYLVFFKMHTQCIPLGLAMFVAITGSASVLGHHVIEKPAIDLGRRLSSSNRLRIEQPVAL